MNECLVAPGVRYSDHTGGLTSQRTRRTAYRPRNSKLSRLMACRLDRLAALVPDPANAAYLRKLSVCVERCATNEAGWRCDRVVCPRCARRKAIRNRKRVDELLDEPSPAAFVTLTVVAHDVVAGLRVLREGFARLRRRRLWQRVVRCGMAGIEVKLADGHANLWNVHLHALVMLCKPMWKAPWLYELWKVVLKKQGSTGSANWKRVTQRRVPVRCPPRRG